jgi:hypothetical protein
MEDCYNLTVNEELLRIIWPKAFCDPPKPLIDGIAFWLELYFPYKHHWYQIKQTLKAWTNTPAYLLAVAQPNAKRVNLGGEGDSLFVPKLP